MQVKLMQNCGDEIQERLEKEAKEKERKCPECSSTQYKMEKCPNGYTTCLNCKRHRLHAEFYSIEPTKMLNNMTIDDLSFNSKVLYTDEYDPNKKIIEHAKYIEVIGGDGSLLKAINRFRHLNKPFFGIAGGTENFLMNTENSISEDAKYKNFRLIKVKVTYTIQACKSEPWESEDIKKFQAFNDVFISEENGWIDFNVHDKDYILGKFKGSGLIISTPQGSTGMNKNNNGVILPLSSKDWSVTGDKTNRKINYVLEQKKMSILVKSRGSVNVFIDGHNNKIENVNKIEISRGDDVYIIFNDYLEFKRKRIL